MGTTHSTDPYLEPSELPPKFQHLAKIVHFINNDTIATEKRIGNGSEGQVWTAKWKEKRVAVKFYHRLMGDADIDAALEKELVLMATSGQKHIVQLHGILVTREGNVGIVMPLASEGSLGSVISSTSSTCKDILQQSPSFKVQICIDIVSGLKWLHYENVMHRDLKPENILISWDGTDYIAMLTDFGLSKLKVVGALNTYCGTVGYMAPEIATPEASTKIDIYALGVVFWEVFSMRRININLPPPSTNELPNTTPNEIKELIQKCLSHTPENRPTAPEIFTTLLTIKRALP